MNLYGEVVFSQWYEFGCNFWDREGRNYNYTTNCTVYRFCACRGHKQSRNRQVVFAGRSNVGKSSLVNMLLNRVALAPTSQRPGHPETRK